MPGDRPHGPEEAEQAAPAERLDASADDRAQPEKVSAADERHLEVLEELPDGHPSSPYGADGRRRSDEPDLRDLELPLPDELGAGSDTPREPEEEHHDYWTEVPRFQHMWSDHEHEWPEETQPAATVDRSCDPEGSWRSDSNLLLEPDTHARTKDAISKVHEAETRVTGDLDHAVKTSPFGGELVGLDYRRKGEDRLKEKVAERLVNEVGRPPEDVVRGIHDAIRYTVRLDNENYAAGCTDIGRRLVADGYTMYHTKNRWEDSQYRGINTRWVNSEGQRFEVQFHTAESYHAKQEITHGAYERIRNPLTTRTELIELEVFQREVSSWIPVPDRATETLRQQERGPDAP